MIRRFLDLIIFNFRHRNQRIKIHITAYVSRNNIMGGGNKICSFSRFTGEIGFGSYIGSHSNILNTKIGKFTSIASNVNVISGSHPIHSPYVSTCPSFYSVSRQNGYSFVDSNKFQERRFANSSRFAVIIGNDCWIGWGATILSGVTISDGAVVYANSTVTKDVPPYAIVAGIPAKIIGYRYDDKTINCLENIKWWNQSLEWLEKNAYLFTNMEEFLNNNK